MATTIQVKENPRTGKYVDIDGQRCEVTRVSFSAALDELDEKDKQIEQLETALKAMLNAFGGMVGVNSYGWAKNEIKAARKALLLEE